jgi:hypothetical protein
MGNTLGADNFDYYGVKIITKTGLFSKSITNHNNGSLASRQPLYNAFMAPETLI